MSWVSKLLRGKTNTYKQNLLNVPTNEELFGSREVYENEAPQPLRRKSKTKKRGKVPKIQERTNFPSKNNQAAYWQQREKGFRPNQITLRGNLRNYPKKIQSALNKQRSTMLGPLYREEGPIVPYKYRFNSTPLPTTPGKITKQEEENIESNILEALKHNTNNNIPEEFKNLMSRNRKSSKATVASDPTSRPSSPYGGKRRKTRKHKVRHHKKRTTRKH